MSGRVVVVSGYFNPIHSGHIDYLESAREIGDYLIVIVNNDKQVEIKRSVLFMNENERVEIIKNIKSVDWVILSIDKNKTVIETIKLITRTYFNLLDYDFVFTKGGDRNKEEIPEREICKKYDIKIIDNVGGGKIQSSSELLKRGI